MSAAALTACLMTPWWLMLAPASSASADPDSSARQSGTTIDGACELLRDAYRLRLLDLATVRRDSAVAVSRERARADSLAVDLRWTAWRLEAARDEAPSWWEDARLSFLAGALAMALVVAATGRLD